MYFLGKIVFMESWNSVINKAKANLVISLKKAVVGVNSSYLLPYNFLIIVVTYVPWPETELNWTCFMMHHIAISVFYSQTKKSVASDKVKGY